MARITVEDCLTRENNRFALVQLASKRTKQLLHGAKTILDDVRGNRPVVTALREIADGRVRFMSEEDRESVRAIAAEKARRVEPSKEPSLERAPVFSPADAPVSSSDGSPLNGDSS